MKLPKRVKVGGLSYAIEVANEILLARNALGRIEHDNLKIQLDDSVAILNVKITLLHEIIHAADAFVPDEHRMTELQVKLLARILFQVFTENPEVGDFIFKEAKGD